MLAYSQGGASTPSGTSASGAQATAAPVHPIQNTATAGIQAASQAAQSMNTNANTRVQESQATLNEVEARKREQEIYTTIASAGHLDAVKDQIRQEMKSFDERMRKLGFETDVAKQHAYEASARWNYTPDNVANEAKALKHKAELLGLEVPEAVNKAAFAKTELGKQAPAIDFGTTNVGRIINSATRAFRR